MDIPSSPALSWCDTLSSPDLDAYLDSLPPLEMLPSPSVTEAWWQGEATSHEVQTGSVMCESHSSYVRNATVLCGISPCSSCKSVKYLPAMVTQFLENCQLSLEMLAVAYNILAHEQTVSLHCWHGEAPAFATESMRSKMLFIHGSESDASCQRALVILSALSLAVAFSDDRPRGLLYWSRDVSQGAFSTDQIGAVHRLLLARLDWQVYPLAAPSAIESAIRVLEGYNDMQTMVTNPVEQLCSKEDSLRLLLSNSYVTINHGLVTPEPSPDCSLFEDELPSYLVSV